MAVVKNPDYWDGAPHLDSVVLKVVPDSNAQVAQLLSGSMDFAEIPPAVMQTLQGKPNVVVDQAPQVNYYYFALNNGNPLFQDKRVRQAMMYAMDRDTIIKSAVFGAAEPALGPISPVLQGFDKNVKTYPYDPEKAKQLLADAGWKPGANGILEKDGKKFSFELLVDKGNTTREQAALIAQKNWKSVGIDARYQFGEFATVVSRYRAGDYDARITYWITPPSVDVYNYWHSKGSSNFTKYGNTELDKLFAQGRTSSDPAESKKIYDRIQEILAEEVPALWIYYPKEVRAFSSRVKAFSAVGYRDAMPFMNRVWLDR
jgi:peptide/nickel transport system substrate-binding protein